MASLRQIRQRIRSTQGTKQIMRAMQLVSGSKLKRAQAKLFQARAVLEFLDGLLERVVAAQQIRNAQRRKDKKRTQPLEHPLSLAREGLPTLLVLLTSDAGLCGSYNTNVIQLAESYLRRDSAQRTHVVYIGKKGHRYFTKRGVPSAESYLDLAGRPNISKADEIGRALMRRFLDGGVGSVQLLYSQFRSATTYRPTVVQWLPIEIRPPSTVHGKTTSSSRRLSGFSKTCCHDGRWRHFNGSCSKRSPPSTARG